MRVLTFVFALVVAAALFAPAAHAESFDRMLPDSTAFYVSIENVERLSEHYKQSPLHALWNDPAVQAFLQKPLGKWAEYMEKEKQKSGITPEEVMDVVRGQMALAIVRLAPDEDARPVVLADVAGNIAKVEKLVADVEEIVLKDGSVRRTEEEFRGVTIVRYRSGEEEDEEGGAARRSRKPNAWFLDGSVFALSSDVLELKRIIALKFDEETAKLADVEAYRRVRARIGERPDAFLYVGVPSIVQAMAEQEGNAGSFARIFSAVMGLEALEGVGVQLSIEPRGVAVKMFAGVPGQKEGILKLFDAKNSALVPPRFVPADAIGVSTMALDWNEILLETRRVANRIQPGGSAQVDGFFEMMKGAAGIDIEKDILGSLGQEMTLYVKMDENAPAQPNPNVVQVFAMPRLVIALSVKDKARLEGAFNALVMMAQGSGMPLEEQDYLGVKLRLIQMPFMPVQPGFAVLPDQFVFAMNNEDVKDVIRRYGKDVPGLVDTEEFARSTAWIPEGRISIGFGRDAKGFQSGLFAGLFMGVGRGGRGAIDLKLLPKAEVLEKYVDVSASAFVNEEAGIYYTHFLAFKEQEQEEPAADEEK